MWPYCKQADSKNKLISIVMKLLQWDKLWMCVEDKIKCY